MYKAMVRVKLQSHTTYNCLKNLIQYFARNWPWYSLRGLHIRITWFSSKTTDTALPSVIALTTFTCIVSASVTKGALVCFVVTVHWWRHGTHYDAIETYRALRNILTVHLNNGATRADLRGITKHCEVTVKAGCQSTIYTGDLMRFSLSLVMEQIHIRILAFYGPGQVQCLWYWTECRPFGPWAPLDRWCQLAWQATSYKLNIHDK